MKRRKQILLISVPILLAVIIGVITTVSLPLISVGPEKVTHYTVSPVSSDFSFESLRVKYYDPDELMIWFDFSGGNGASDLRLEIVCRDESGNRIFASTSGTVTLEALDKTVTNQTIIQEHGLVEGVLRWYDVPSGTQRVKIVFVLEDIVLDTENFFIELRNMY